jgi:hypothetical protein
MGARYYNSIWGVETSSDAYWWKRPDQSSYVFCSNDPINRIDPDGNFDTQKEATRYRNSYGGDVLYANDKQEWFVSKQVKYNGAGIAIQRIFDYGQEAGSRVYGTGSTQAMELPTARHIGPGIDGSYIAPFGANTGLGGWLWLAKIFRGGPSAPERAVNLTPLVVQEEITNVRRILKVDRYYDADGYHVCREWEWDEFPYQPNNPRSGRPYNGSGYINALDDNLGAGDTTDVIKKRIYSDGVVDTVRQNWITKKYGFSTSGR